MGQDNIVVVIFVAVGVLVVGSIIIYYTLRRLKGKLTVVFDNRSYSPGEVLSGRVQLHCRKQVEYNRFFVALVCHEVIRRHSGGKSQTVRSEILRQEQDLADPGVFPAGTDSTHEFAIPVPQAPNAGAMLSTGNQTADAVINTVDSVVSARRGRLEWALEARVDAKGVDLASRHLVSINAR